LRLCVSIALTITSAKAAPGFQIINFSTPSTGQVVLRWSAETNAFTNLSFTVERATGLGLTFAPLSPPIPENSSMVFTDSVSSTASAGFYRVAAAAAFTPLNQPGAFSAYAATNVNGLSTAGYAGAVFDGRYVYFVPYQNNVSAHGRVLRLDTEGNFSAPSSWLAYDATAAVGAGAVGFTGGVFDGRYVHFSPQITIGTRVAVEIGARPLGCRSVSNSSGLVQRRLYSDISAA